MTMLRIATFNVLCGHVLSGPPWAKRQPLLRRAIDAAQADVMGLQEVLPSKLADAADLVAPLTFVPGPSTGAARWYVSERNHAGEHLPIAYRADRFRHLDSGGFWISARPDHPGSLLPLAPAPFLVHWARLGPLDGSEELLVMNAHFGHAPWHHAPTARIFMEQLSALESSRGVSPSVFLFGDFNAVPSSTLLRLLTSASGARFMNAARSAADRSGPSVTYHWGRGATRLGLTLDYVLARTPFRPARAEVIDVHDGRLYPSDHHLLALEFVRGSLASPDAM